jgi:hypothetical protein
LLFRENESIELLAPRTLLPGDLEKGSILKIDIVSGNIKSVVYLKEETAAVRNQNQQLLEELVKKNPSL